MPEHLEPAKTTASGTKVKKGWREDGTKSSAGMKAEADLPNGFNAFERELAEDVSTIARLERFRFQWAAIAVADKWNKTVTEHAKFLIDQRREEILNGGLVTDDDDVFPTDRINNDYGAHSNGV